MVAQDSANTVTAQMTGSVITASEPWRHLPDFTSSEPEREVIVMSGTNDILIVGFLSTESAGEDPIAQVLGEHAATIGPLTDVDRRERYALQTAVINDVPYGLFSLTYTNRNPGVVEVHAYLSPASTFDTGFAGAQGNVSVNGAPVFSGVNGRTLQSLIVANAGPGNAATDAALSQPLTATPVVTAEEEPAEEPPDTSVVEPIATPVPDQAVATPMATPAAALTRPVVDVSMYADVGIVEDGLYISPQFGIEVTWDARWTVLQTSDESAVKANWVTRTDSVTLMSTVYPETIVVISVMSTYDFGMDDWSTAFNARDDDAFPELLTKMGPTSGVAVVDANESNLMFLFDVGTSDNGSVFHEVEVQGTGSVVIDAFDTVGGITVDGEPVFQTLTTEEIQAALP